LARNDQVKETDGQCRRLLVRDREGQKDRSVPLPQRSKQSLKEKTAGDARATRQGGKLALRVRKYLIEMRRA
jgi:hypothetical protein